MNLSPLRESAYASLPNPITSQPVIRPQQPASRLLRAERVLEHGRRQARETVARRRAMMERDATDEDVSIFF